MQDYQEWLQDYQARDIDEFRIFIKKFKAGENIQYPSPQRFPIAYSANIFGFNIWSKIPLYGSTIISLAPLTQDRIVGTYGWGSYCYSSKSNGLRDYYSSTDQRLFD